MVTLDGNHLMQVMVDHMVYHRKNWMTCFLL